MIDFRNQFENNSIKDQYTAIEQFLKLGWQKEICLFKADLNQALTPLPSAEELLGLALEDDVESSLVICRDANDQHGNTDLRYQLKNGPFDESALTTLGDQNWTLLIQRLDQLFECIDDLSNEFNFLPHWRYANTMASLSMPGGSVGPHFDYYDVFLWQISGEKEWRLSQSPMDENSRLNTDSGLRLLADFQPDFQLTTTPGDIVYLPPGIAHWGIANTPSTITYSIGFRAPTAVHLLSGLAQYLKSTSANTHFFNDDELRIHQHGGELTTILVKRIQQLIGQYIENPESLLPWLGQYLTTIEQDWSIDDIAIDIAIEAVNSAPATQVANDGHHFLAKLRQASGIRRSPASRIAYSRHDQQFSLLFADGNMLKISTDQHALIELLCNNRQLTLNSLSPFLNNFDSMAILDWLINQGTIYCQD